MPISVVVVSYNVTPLLRRALESVRDAAEIIVVDNASPDDCGEVVRREFPWAKLIVRADNGGFAVAANEGVHAASHDLVLIMNPDACLPADALGDMVQIMKQRSRAAVVGFRQVDEAGRFQLSIGPPPSLLLDFARKLVQLQLDKGAPWLERGLDLALHSARRVPWVSGAAMLVRREVFTALGGFDERFFLYFEDIDLCLRARAAGHEVWFDPRLTVSHARGASARTARGLASRAYRESQLYFWGKHRGARVRSVVGAYLRLRGLLPAAASP
jgi:N-acetylglucosaminyl-diphospho-decaprenol L-rhamnosyltransferase